MVVEFAMMNELESQLSCIRKAKNILYRPKKRQEREGERGKITARGKYNLGTFLLGHAEIGWPLSPSLYNVHIPNGSRNLES